MVAKRLRTSFADFDPTKHEKAGLTRSRGERGETMMILDDITGE